MFSFGRRGRLFIAALLVAVMAGVGGVLPLSSSHAAAPRRVALSSLNGVTPPVLAPTVQDDSLSDEERTIRIYEMAAPAVVLIRCTVNGKNSTGSGAIISAKGMILTSRHVVGDNKRVMISLANGKVYQARVLTSEANPVDLALLQIEPRANEADARFPYLQLGDSSAVRVGQHVLAIGNPYGFERTLTLGVVSRIDTLRARLQTDAAINPGNSGGPLLDRRGRIIGVNQSLFNPDQSATNIGIGFAVPVDLAKKLIARLSGEATTTAARVGTSHITLH
jgi:S1-C subfamily serine protease